MALVAGQHIKHPDACRRFQVNTPDLFDTRTFLSKIVSGKTIGRYRPKKAVFRQGDASNSVFYIEKGKAKLTVLSMRGKEGVIAILGVGDFLGEECLVDQTHRITTRPPPCLNAGSCESTKTRRSRRCVRIQCFPSNSWPICWRGTSGPSRIWRLSSSTPAKSGWREYCSCWRIMERITNRTW